MSVTHEVAGQEESVDLEIWCVLFKPEEFTDELYDLGLQKVDTESQARIKRFYRREDSYRCLLGRLLPRAILKKRGVPIDKLEFDKTAAGKPYFKTGALKDRFGFNVSHDNGLVAMAAQWRPSSDGASAVTGQSAREAVKIGVDVMKVALPRYEKTLQSFVEAIRDTLTPSELSSLRDYSVPTADLLQRLFKIWTLKEAYTKALGLGLGFDFQRIEYKVSESQVTIDGQVPHGWEFTQTTLTHNASQGFAQEEYVLTVCRFVGGQDIKLRIATHLVAETITQFGIQSLLQIVLE